MDAAKSSVTGLQDSVGSINTAATGAQNLLGTGSESALSQRDAALAAQPGFLNLTEQNLAAQQAQMRNQTNFGQGQLARQAMGVAAGQGEGGALAAQSALAGLSQAGGQMATQNNLAFGQMAADQRAKAAQDTRAEAVGTADLGLKTRIDVQDKQADYLYSGAKDTVEGQSKAATAGTNLAKTAGEMATSGQVIRQADTKNLTETDAKGEATARDYMGNILNIRSGLADEKQDTTAVPALRRLGVG
jgi:hypothetical protein